MISFLAERVLDMACAIQQIPAPPFAESKRSDFVFQQFQKLGLKNVYQDNLSNVYACIPGGGKASPLIVSAHIDTVFPSSTDLAIKKEEERIYGPGIGDNSLGVAALFGLAWAILPTEADEAAAISRFPGDIWLVANVGEEGLGNLRGIRAVVEQFAGEVKAYLVLEGMALGQVYHRALGSMRFRISAKTAGGHSWMNYGDPSAIHELAKLVTRLSEIYIPACPRTTLNVGIISGGTSINTIAAEATLELDLRSEDSTALQTLVTQVDRLVKAANKKGVEMVAEEIGNRPSGGIPETHPLIQLALNTLKDHGLQPNLIIGSTDANIPLSLGYPSVVVGISNGFGAHTVGEFVQTKPVALGMAQLVSLVEGIFEKL